ncbi:MAG TPA: NTF2 fold immunity protein [Candidatus Acidoferrales bacterium]|nr:NTF2 fold immunity protein [Candidatus Acidoferrales bacterium]
MVLTLLLAIVAFAQKLPSAHPDYVPDETTAKKIAEAVMIGQYGEERVKAQLPLLVASRGKSKWVVQGRVVDKEGRPQVGGGFGVLLDKHNGCVLEVVENMK